MDRPGNRFIEQEIIHDKKLDGLEQANRGKNHREDTEEVVALQGNEGHK
jgi:hypothetical protein